METAMLQVTALREEANLQAQAIQHSMVLNGEFELPISSDQYAAVMGYIQSEDEVPPPQPAPRRGSPGRAPAPQIPVQEPDQDSIAEPF